MADVINTSNPPQKTVDEKITEIFGQIEDVGDKLKWFTESVLGTSQPTAQTVAAAAPKQNWLPLVVAAVAVYFLFFRR